MKHYLNKKLHLLQIAAMKSTIQFVKTHKVLIGTIWGILTTLLSLYLTFFPIEQNPRLTLYEKSKFDLFAIDEPIEELQIILNGVDLKDKKHNLKVYQFKLINNGKSDIRTTDYSAEVPFGLKIKNGRMVKIDIGKSHRTYTAKSLLKKQHPDSSKIQFNKVFLGENEYVLFELWVEYENGKEPIVSIHGKIADTPIELTNKEESKIKSIWNDYLLPICGGIGILIAFIILIKILEKTYDSISNFLRRQIILKKYDHHYDRSNRRHRLIAKIYANYGKTKFIEVLKKLLDQDNLQRTFNSENENAYVVESFISLAKEKRTSLSAKDADIDFHSPFLEVVFMLEEAELAKIHEPENEDLYIEIDNEILTDMKFALRLVEGYE